MGVCRLLRGARDGVLLGDETDGGAHREIARVPSLAMLTSLLALGYCNTPQHYGTRPVTAVRSPTLLTGITPETPEEPSLSEQAASLASTLRARVEEAEEELHVEVTHSKKFMWRGDGLKSDFAKAGRSRRRALMQGAADNERALILAINEAEAAGLPREYTEEAIRVVHELAITRGAMAELERDTGAADSSNG